MKIISGEKPVVRQFPEYWTVTLVHQNVKPTMMYSWAYPFMDEKHVNVRTRYLPDVAREEWVERMRHENRVPDQATVSVRDEHDEGDPDYGYVVVDWRWFEIEVRDS